MKETSLTKQLKILSLGSGLPHWPRWLCFAILAPLLSLQNLAVSSARAEGTPTILAWKWYDTWAGRGVNCGQALHLYAAESPDGNGNLTSCEKAIENANFALESAYIGLGFKCLASGGAPEIIGEGFSPAENVCTYTSNFFTGTKTFFYVRQRSVFCKCDFENAPSDDNIAPTGENDTWAE